jgi:hypothetical protein
MPEKSTRILATKNAASSNPEAGSDDCAADTLKPKESPN